MPTLDEARAYKILAAMESGSRLRLSGSIDGSYLLDEPNSAGTLVDSSFVGLLLEEGLLEQGALVMTSFGVDLPPPAGEMLLTARGRVRLPQLRDAVR